MGVFAKPLMATTRCGHSFLATAPGCGRQRGERGEAGDGLPGRRGEEGRVRAAGELHRGKLPYISPSEQIHFFTSVQTNPCKRDAETDIFVCTCPGRAFTNTSKGLSVLSLDQAAASVLTKAHLRQERSAKPPTRPGTGDNWRAASGELQH